MQIKSKNMYWQDKPDRKPKPPVTRKLRPTFNSALRGWIQNILVDNYGTDGRWFFIDIPLDYSKGFDQQTRKQIKTAHNYRRMRDDYASTKMEVRISTGDCPRGCFRLWCKITMRRVS